MKKMKKGSSWNKRKYVTHIFDKDSYLEYMKDFYKSI